MANSSSDASEPRFPHSGSDSFCTAALDSLPEPVIACTPEGELVYVNQRAREMTGTSEEEIVSVHFPELCADPSERDASRSLRGSIGQAPTQLDATLHTESGRAISCTVEGSFVEQNGIALLFGILREGAELPHQKDDAPDREVEFRHLVKEVEEYAIFMLDPEGHVTSWNEGAERIKGYTEEEIIGTHFSTFYPPEAVEAGMPARVLETAAQEGQWTGEGWRIRQDGSRFWANVTVTALHGEDEAVRGFAKVTRDMTERHRRELELERQKQRAEEAKQHADRENTLLQLMQAVAATANDADGLEEALQQAVDIICEHIDWPVGHVYWFEEAEETPLIPTGIWFLDQAERFEKFREVTEAVNFAIGESLPGQVASTGEAAWIRDVTTDSNFVRTKRAQNLGVRGAFGVPIPHNDGIAAVLEFFSENEEEPDAQLMEAMASVGVQLSRVAEREQARRALRRSEKRYRRLFETSQEGIVIQAADWTVTDLNPATEEILGYDREELIGRNPTDLFVNLDQYERAQQLIKEEGQFRNVEFDFRRRDGEVIVCEATSTMQPSADDSEMFYTIFRDITERKRMQEALEESEKRYRRLFEESRDAVLLTTPAGAVVDANSAAEDLFGYSSEELLDMGAAELYADPEERARRIVPKLKEARTARIIEAEMRHRDGHTFPATASVTVHRDEEGHPELIQALVRDITEWRRLQAELLEVQDEERQRLGQELHDGVCSTLTGVAILTSSLASEVRADEPIDPDDLDKATEFVKQASDEARAISHGLSPVGLERGLLSALEDLASQTEVRGELSCSFEASGSLPDLSEETATHLYRIAQEAVNNAVKHADAQHIRVVLAADDEEALTLAVEDDGKGYPASSSEGEGIGMRTMRYRADLINAALTIEDAPDGGTRVRCRLPFPEYS